MPELPHPARTDLTSPATPCTPDALTATDVYPALTGATAQGQDTALAVDALPADEIHGLPTRRSSAVSDLAHELMNTEHPTVGAVEGSELSAGALDDRVQQEMNRVPAHPLKETFRDNPLEGRFELLIDGALAAHLMYTMRAGQVVLTDGVEHPGYRDQGMDVILMRHVVLTTHKRGLNLVPQCPMAFSFLADHSHDQALTAPTTN